MSGQFWVKVFHEDENGVQTPLDTDFQVSDQAALLHVVVDVLDENGSAKRHVVHRHRSPKGGSQ